MFKSILVKIRSEFFNSFRTKVFANIFDWRKRLQPFFSHLMSICFISFEFIIDPPPNKRHRQGPVRSKLYHIIKIWKFIFYRFFKKFQTEPLKFNDVRDFKFIGWYFQRFLQISLIHSRKVQHISEFLGKKP